MEEKKPQLLNYAGPPSCGVRFRYVWIAIGLIAPMSTAVIVVDRLWAVRAEQAARAAALQVKQSQPTSRTGMSVQH